MEIEYLNESNTKEWDEFVNNSDSTWFRHTTDWLKYSMCCRFDSDTINHSFMVKQNKEILAIVPLLSEYDYNNKTEQIFAMYSDYTPIVALKNNCNINKKSLMETIKNQIVKIAGENNVKRGRFFIDPLIKKNYSRDFYTYNMLDNSPNSEYELITTNIIDLEPDLEYILRNMRKGHKAAIKSTEKKSNFRVDIFDKNNITKEKFLILKKFHLIDAGRQTRTDESWNCMYEWVTKGHSFLVLLWLDELNDYVCASQIITYKDRAYYGFFATTNSFAMDGLCGYAMQWAIIKYLKMHNFKYYEMGRNHSTRHNNSEEDQKLSNIAKFKRGFRSHEFVTLTYNIKYSNKE